MIAIQRLLLITASLAFAVPAWAQAPAEPPPKPGAYWHDGFYARLALGVTLIRDSFDAHGDGVLFGDSKGTIKGFGQAHEIAIGGSVAPGLAIAGAAIVDLARTTSADYQGERVNPKDGYVLVTFGPLVDFYPAADGGFHAYAGGGLALSSGVQPQGVEGGSGSGIGLFGGVGYDFWIAPQWALGPMFRFQYVSTKESAYAIFDTLEVTHHGMGFTLMCSATYN